MSAPPMQPQPPAAGATPAVPSATTETTSAAAAAPPPPAPPRVTLQQPSPYTHLTQPLASSSLAPASQASRPSPIAFSGAPQAFVGPAAAAGSQVRGQPVQVIHTVGMTGALSTAQLRANATTGLQPQRLVQVSLQAPANQGLTSQKIQQNQQLMHQKMPSELKQGNVPSTSTLYRPPQRPQVPQQRAHLPQSMSGASHQPHMVSSQQLPQHILQQRPHALQLQQHKKQMQQPHQMQQQHMQQHSSVQDVSSGIHSQQMAAVRNQSNQQQTIRHPITVTQRSDASTQLGADADTSNHRILSKRSIQELMAQIDPQEKLEPEVEEVLIDIAEDFVDSVSTFACSLAKHRKSSTLEAKDILLHAERAWNIQLPGYSGDEIRLYKKQHVNDIHRERLAVVKKSMAAGDGNSNTRNAAAQASSNPKGQAPKAPFVGSPAAS